jgi:16S rRNA processing protein RimM
MRISDPVAYNKGILLGRITKVHGFDGSVNVRLERTYIENIPEMESLFLEIEGRAVPFFISSIDYAGADILKIKFEDYNSFEKIKEFQGCKVFLTDGEDDKTLPDIDISRLEGTRVFLPDNRFIGVIREVIVNPLQLILVVINDSDKEILIPYHEDFIVEKDEQEKRITMNLPNGLTEINSL